MPPRKRYDDGRDLRECSRGMAALTKAAAWPPHSKGMLTADS